MQIDVAVAADVDRTYISRVEAGKARITFNFISKLVKGLEITSNELIAGDDIPYVKNLSYTAEGDDTNNQKIS